MPFPQRSVSPVGPMPLQANFQGPGASPTAPLPQMQTAIPEQGGGGGVNPMAMMAQYMMWKKMMGDATQPEIPTGFEDAWQGFMGGPTGAWGGGGLLGTPGTFQIPDISGSWFGGGGLGY